MTSAQDSLVLSPTDELIQRAEALAEEKPVAFCLKGDSVVVFQQTKPLARAGLQVEPLFSSSGRELVPELVRALKEERAERQRIETLWHEAEAENVANRNARVEAGERSLDAVTTGYDWMVAYDVLNGWVTSHPEMLKRLIADRPNISLPKPAHVPENTSRALAAEAALASANRRNSETIEACAKIAEHCGPAADMRDDELSKDFGLPRRLFSRSIAAAIRALL